MGVRVSIINDDDDESERKPIINTPQKFSDYLYIEEVADLLGVARPAIMKRISKGYFHPTRGKKPGETSRGGPKLMFNPIEVAMEIERVQTLMKQKPGSLVMRPNANLYSIEKPEPPQKKRGRPPNPNKPIAEKSPIKPSDKPSIKTDGTKCAKAVKLFRLGKGMLDIVEEMELDFETGAYFWESYLKGQPSWVLTPKDFARIRSILNWREDPPTVEGFNQALNKCMTEAPERASLMSTKESAAIDAALAKIEPSEEDE